MESVISFCYDIRTMMCVCRNLSLNMLYLWVTCWTQRLPYFYFRKQNQSKTVNPILIRANPHLDPY